jgi:uridylate kinase
MGKIYKYKRVLLKLGGEALASSSGVGIDPKQADKVADIIGSVTRQGVQIAIVVGAGNLWRGSTGTDSGMERTIADHMGMLATVMNAIALQDALERSGIATRVQTAIEMRDVAEPYIWRRAVRHLEKDRVVILGGGTGNPFFTTDTAGALRAVEIDADILIKATKVDGVYSSDPQENSDAKKFDSLTYMEAINLRLKVMDSTALSLCMDNNMPIAVINLWEENSLLKVVNGDTVGTLVFN